MAQDYKLIIIPTATNYIAEEPVMLTMWVKNEATAEREMFLGWDGIGGLRFGTNLSSLQTNMLLRQGGYLRRSSLKLGPSDRHQETIVLDEWLRLPPGEHTVIAENRRENARATFPLNILPYNQEALTEKLGLLIRQAQKRGTVNYGDPVVQALRAAYRRSEACRRIITQHPETRPDLIMNLKLEPTD